MISFKRVYRLMCFMVIAIYLVGCATSSPEKTRETSPEPLPQEEQADKEDYVVAAEEMPRLKSIGKINYPDRARKAGIEGTVIVQFIVNKQGEIEYPEVRKGIGGGCDEEAIRIVKEAEFVPGRRGGVPVRVQYSLPIKFELPD